MQHVGYVDVLSMVFLFKHQPCRGQTWRASRKLVSLCALYLCFINADVTLWLVIRVPVVRAWKLCRSSDKVACYSYLCGVLLFFVPHTPVIPVAFFCEIINSIAHGTQHFVQFFLNRALTMSLWTERPFRFFRFCIPSPLP